MDSGKVSIGKMLAKELGYYYFDRYEFTSLSYDLLQGLL